MDCVFKRTSTGAALAWLDTRVTEMMLLVWPVIHGDVCHPARTIPCRTAEPSANARKRARDGTAEMASFMIYRI